MKQTGKKKLCCTVFVIAAITAAIALCVFFYLREKKKTEAVPGLPDWAVWETRDESADLDGDGEAEQLHLADGTLSVSARVTLLYETKDEWKISDFYAQDITGNGKTEIVMLAWKKGSFGTSKPFWIERDDTGWSQHIFVFESRDGKTEPLWMSSDLGMEVREWRTDEEKRLHLISGKGTETIWVWDSWGFTLVGEQPADAGNEGPAPSATPGKAESGADGSRKEGAGDADGSGKEGGDDDSGEMTMLAVGDNLIHESIYRTCADAKNGTFDFTPLYKEVKEEISRYDLAAVNQETALVSDPGLYGSFPDFGTPSEAGDALADAGFDLVCAATNHVNDKGKVGLEETLRFWEQHPEITLLGLHGSAEDYQKIDFVEKNGIRLALFNYTFGLNGHALPKDEKWRVNLLTDEQKLIRDLEAAEKAADVSVCFLHAGAEYSGGPSAELREMAERLTAAGADLIICTHPHVVQKAEILCADPSEKNAAIGNSGEKKEPDTGAAGGEMRGESRAENGNIEDPEQDLEQDPSTERRSIVCWSLGNFISNQMNLETAVGAAADIRFSIADLTSGGEISSVEVSGGNTIPVEASGGNTMPVEASGDEISSGEPSGGETLSGEIPSGETSSKETLSGETSSGETSSGETSSEETLSGETSSGETISGSESGSSKENFRWSTDPLRIKTCGEREIIITCSLRPAVCHFRDGNTKVFFLESYTDELAAVHSLSTEEHPLSVRSLLAIWRRRTQ